MNEWFGLSSPHTFQLFSPSHLLALTAALSGIFFQLTWKRLFRSDKLFSFTRWFLFSLLVLSELSYQAWTIRNGVWQFSDHVPLHLCGIASVFAIIALAFPDKKLIQIVFFIGIIPAFLALLTPDVPYDYQHYRFWKFFLHHMTISWASLFLALAYPAAVTLRALFFTYGCLLLYALVVGTIINPLADANYLYLANTPTAVTLLDWFGTGWRYYLNLCIAALSIFLVQFLLWKWYTKKQKLSTR